MRMKKNVLSWFGHVERMSDERMAKKIYDGKASGKRGRGRTAVDLRKHIIKDTGGRSCKKHEGPRRACMKRLMTVDEVKEVCRDRSV